MVFGFSFELKLPPTLQQFHLDMLFSITPLSYIAWIALRLLRLK